MPTCEVRAVRRRIRIHGWHRTGRSTSLTAWIAKQPWCNGRVGGIGQPYYAMAQWLMAKLNPPGLACIAPYGRAGRPVPLLELSRRHFLHLPFHPGTQPARRQPASPRGQDGACADAVRLAGAITEHTFDDHRWRERSGCGSTTSGCRCSRLGIGARWVCTCAATSLAFEEMRAPKKLVVTGAKNCTRHITSTIRWNFTGRNCCRSTICT